jgi:protein FRA10AC1
MPYCRFIREDADNAPGGWEVEVARKYYAKLFREYCIADLSRYKVAIGAVRMAEPCM